jgi:hypothetical protein
MKTCTQNAYASHALCAIWYTNSSALAIFQVLTEASMIFWVSWTHVFAAGFQCTSSAFRVVCRLVENDQRLRGAYCLHHQDNETRFLALTEERMLKVTLKTYEWWRWWSQWGETTSLSSGHQRAYGSSPRRYMSMENYNGMMSTGENSWFVHQSALW